MKKMNNNNKFKNNNILGSNKNHLHYRVIPWVLKNALKIII